MKKKAIIVIILLVLILFGISVLLFNNDEATEVGVFTLKDYARELEEFYDGRLLGETNNERDAKEKAEQVWISKFGNSIKKEKPYCVYYDSQSETWLVKGSFPKDWLGRDVLGGVAYILIQKTNGKVLAVWHDA